MINDNYIIDKFYNKEKHKLISPRIQRMTLEEKEYLENRFSDIFESHSICIYRILYKVEHMNKCPYCGNYCKFDKNNISNNYCKLTCGSKECKGIDLQRRLNEYLKQFGLTNSYQLEKSKQSAKKTCLKKYGTSTYRNPEKQKQTMLDRYGATAMIYTDWGDRAIHNKKVKEKEFDTKRKRGTLNSSKLEKLTYEKLLKLYPDIKCQYKDKIRYPFACDFYIPSQDLFIECNYHWTHGGHPYDENSLEDAAKLDVWKNKHTKYYDNAINTWTVRDVNKRNTAKQNNLNYIEFWSYDDLLKYY